jgi:hypothetical protein
VVIEIQAAKARELGQEAEQVERAGVCAVMIHRAGVIASPPVFVAAGAAAQELPPRRHRPTW